MARTAAFLAIVTGVSGQTVTLDLEDGGTDSVQKLRHVTCATGDLAHVVTIGRSRFVDGVVGSSSAPVPEAAVSVPPPAPQSIVTGSWLFGPTDPGTWRSGDWRTDTVLLWQGVYGSGSPQYGAAWYGDGPSALPGALTGASVTLCRAEGPIGLVTPTVALYAGTSRPDDAPALVDAQLGPALLLGQPQDWTLPDAWLQPLQDGSAGGLGCYLPSATPGLALTPEGSGMTLTLRWRED